MDRGRVTKVENVTCWRQSKRVEGTLNLDPHHIVFRYPLPSPIGAEDHKPVYKSSFLAYPLISYCTYRPSPPASPQPPSLRIRFRDFTYISYHFLTDEEAWAAYDTIKSYTCNKGRLERLYAFTYKEPAEERAIKGWNLYDPKKEFARLGISSKSTDKGWRITNINAKYEYSPTYPAVLVVPSSVSDNVLKYAGNYRSRVRIPALTYLHPINNCSITRSAQPKVGIRGGRNAQDEKLVAAIWKTSNNPTAIHSTPATPIANRSTTDLSTSPDNASSPDNSIMDSELIEDEAIINSINVEPPEDEQGGGRHVYGSTQQNLIVDARPTLNALAMQAAGLGSENMEHYKGSKKVYLGIDNIHVMRKSLNAVIDALKDSDFSPLPPNKDQLTSSKWLWHIGNLLEGASTIAWTVGIGHSHVLIHCSDGWDRTSQLSALSQLCLDPYYRTIEGFAILIEKDWLSFGHMFRKRTGPLSSESWFEIENERLANNRANLNGSSSGSGNAFENALSKAQGFFKKTANQDSSESDPEISNAKTEAPTKMEDADVAKGDRKSKYETQLKEVSPMFHQFLDATYQLLHQHPTRFEFTERFLRRLLYHLYACQYGTFLYDSELERLECNAKEKTGSVWDHFLARKREFINKDYDPEVNDRIDGKDRVIFPKRENIRWWAEVFGRADSEMNGHGSGHSPSPADIDVPVVTGVETGEQAIGVGTTRPPREQQPHSRSSSRAAQGTNPLQGISAGLASLGIGSNSSSPSRSRSPNLSKEMEVEMQ